MKKNALAQLILNDILQRLTRTNNKTIECHETMHKNRELLPAKWKKQRTRVKLIKDFG